MAGKREPDARLEILSGRDAGKKHDLTRDKRYGIGTARKAQIRLKDAGVQFRHAAIYFAEDCFWLITERAGCEATLLDTPLIPQVPSPLSSGDQITLGPVKARFIRLDREEERPEEEAPKPDPEGESQTT
jgi:predicted component of type VI protein secretion system